MNKNEMKREALGCVAACLKLLFEILIFFVVVKMCSR